MKVENVVRLPVHRPNLHLRFEAGDEDSRVKKIVAWLEADRKHAAYKGAGIVYCTMQKQSEEMADGLVKAGFSARAYHAGMKPGDRESVQEWFMRDNNDAVVCATIAFGMGIDKRDIRFVYHIKWLRVIFHSHQHCGDHGVWT